MARRIFVQISGVPGVHLLDADESQPVSTLPTQLVASGAASVLATHVFLESANEPLQEAASLDSAGVVENATIHVARCVRIHVTVRYSGRADITRDFSPAEKIEQVLKWATGKQGFDMPQHDALDFALQVCGQEEAARLDDHVGTVLPSDSCSLCLNLIPTDRIQG